MGGAGRWQISRLTEQTARPKKRPDTQKMRLKHKTRAPSSKKPENNSYMPSKSLLSTWNSSVPDNELATDLK